MRYNSSSSSFSSSRLRSPKKEETEIPEDSSVTDVNGREIGDVMDELEGILSIDDEENNTYISKNDNGYGYYGYNFQSWDLMDVDEQPNGEDEDGDYYYYNKFDDKFHNSFKEEYESHCSKSNAVTKKECAGISLEEEEEEEEDYNKEKSVCLNLNLNLNYQEVMDAWSDRGPLWANDSSLYSTSSNYMGEVPVMEEERRRREASVMRYKEKRQTRLFCKKIRYQVRKLNADKRPRLKGRFVKRVS